MSVLQIVFVLIRGFVADRSELAAENLALRQLLAALQYSLNARGCGSVIGSSGRFYLGFGRIGVPPWFHSFCRLRSSFEGLARDPGGTPR